MVSFRQLIRNVPCLCASVAHVAIFWISGPFLWPFVVYFMLLLVIVFSTDSTNPDSLPIPLFIFFLSFLWMALFIFIASRILITYNGDSDSLLSPIDTIYSGHCIRCRRILMRSRLLRGWAKSLGSQSEVYAFHFDEEAFNIPSNSTGTNTNTNDESSSYASCSLCKLLISSLQSRRPNPKQIRRSEAETLLTSTSDGYGTLSGSRLTCSRKFEMEIFRERTSTFIRLHASNKSSPAFKVHTCKSQPSPPVFCH